MSNISTNASGGSDGKIYTIFNITDDSSGFDSVLSSNDGSPRADRIEQYVFPSARNLNDIVVEDSSPVHVDFEDLNRVPQICQILSKIQRIDNEVTYYKDLHIGNVYDHFILGQDVCISGKSLRVDCIMEGGKFTLKDTQLNLLVIHDVKGELDLHDSCHIKNAEFGVFLKPTLLNLEPFVNFVRPNDIDVSITIHGIAKGVKVYIHEALKRFITVIDPMSVDRIEWFSDIQ